MIEVTVWNIVFNRLHNKSYRFMQKKHCHANTQTKILLVRRQTIVDKCTFISVGITRPYCKDKHCLLAFHAE